MDHETGVVLKAAVEWLAITALIFLWSLPEIIKAWRGKKEDDDEDEIEPTKEGDVEVEESPAFKHPDIVCLKSSSLGLHGVTEGTRLHVGSVDEETGVVRCWWIDEDNFTHEAEFDPETLEYADD